MEKNDDKRQQLIREVLAPTADAGRVPARAMGAWRRLAAHLCPLVGEAGFCALYGRAVRLSALGESWQAAPLGVRSVEVLFAAHEHNLAALDPARAGAANAALLETFTRLLSGLIGEALTARLLNTAWAERPDGKST